MSHSVLDLPQLNEFGLSSLDPNPLQNTYEMHGKQGMRAEGRHNDRTAKRWWTWQQHRCLTRCLAQLLGLVVSPTPSVVQPTTVSQLESKSRSSYLWRRSGVDHDQCIDAGPPARLVVQNRRSMTFNANPPFQAPTSFSLAASMSTTSNFLYDRGERERTANDRVVVISRGTMMSLWKFRYELLNIKSSTVR